MVRQLFEAGGWSWASGICAFASMLALTPLVIYFAHRMNWVAQPKADRWHKRPTALMGGIAAAGLAWRAGRKLEQPIVALIKSAERIGQGDYTRPLDVARRDEIGELQQALERMRYKLRQTTITKDYLNSVLNGLTDAVFVTSPTTVGT